MGLFCLRPATRHFPAFLLKPWPIRALAYAGTPPTANQIKSCARSATPGLWHRRLRCVASVRGPRSRRCVRPPSHSPYSRGRSSPLVKAPGKPRAPANQSIPINRRDDFSLAAASVFRPASTQRRCAQHQSVCISSRMVFLIRASPKTRFHRGPALEISSTAFKLPFSPCVNNRIGPTPIGNRQSRSQYSLHNRRHLYQTTFRCRLRHANIKFAISLCRPIDLAQTNHHCD